MAQHNDLGKEGEAIAQKFLQQEGYKILHTNWKTGNFELDIVAQKDNLLIIIEVKTRSTDFFEHPKDAVTPSKIKRIISATNDYIFTFNIQSETRFDIVSVIPQKNGNYKIEHIKDAFLPPIE